MKRIFRRSVFLGCFLQLLVVVFSLTAGAAFADDIDDGVAYYQRGEYKKAFGVIKRLAERGQPDAQFLLSEMYRTGKGIRKNERLAGKWMQKAAEEGYLEAQLALAQFYRDGFGELPKNKAKAFFWYEKAAEQGSDIAQFQLGLAFELGDGVAASVKEARFWYEKAAEQDNANAKERLLAMEAQAGD